MNYNLKKGGNVTYISKYLTDTGISLLWDELKTTEVFKQPVMFETKNKECIEVEGTFAKSKSGITYQQILTDFYGDKIIAYPRYTTSMFDPYVNPRAYFNSDTYDTALKNWTPCVKKLKEEIEQQFNEQISYAIIHEYRSTADSIAYHSDREMNPRDKIYSISIGISRKFGFREKFNENGTLKTSGAAELELILENGCLTIFDYDAGYKNYKHSIFKGLKRDGHLCMNDPYSSCKGGHDIYKCCRINITFRTFY